MFLHKWPIVEVILKYELKYKKKLRIQNNIKITTQTFKHCCQNTNVN